MKTGNVISENSIMNKGFIFYVRFAGYRVYRKVNNKSVKYVFLNPSTEKIITILKLER